MARLNTKSNLFRSSLACFLVIASVIVFYRLLDSLGNLLSLGGSIYQMIMKIFLPFIMGGVIAYLLLPLCRLMEQKLFRKMFTKHPEKAPIRRRMLSAGICYVVVLALLAWFLSYLAPILWENIRDFVLALPDLYPEAERLFQNIVQELDKATGNLISIEDIFNKIWIQIQNYLVTTSAALPSILTKFGTSLIGTLVDTAIAVISGFYLLLYGKEISRAFSRFSHAVLGERHTFRIKRTILDLDSILGRYVQARLVESLVVFGLCLVFFAIFGVRFGVLLALVNGVTNLVPYFGPIVGWAITTILVLLDNPMQALWCAVFLIIVQTYDGYYLGPRLQGKGLNLNSLWVIFAISAGGVLFKVPGMLLGAPVLAYIRLVLSRYTDRKLQEKQADLFNMGAGMNNYPPPEAKPDPETGQGETTPESSSAETTSCPEDREDPPADNELKEEK